MELERTGHSLAQRLLSDALARQSRVGRTDVSGADAGQRTPSSATNPSTNVEFSASAREFNRAKAVARSTNGVRADEVARIKQQLRDGTYTTMLDVLEQKLLGGGEHAE